MATAFDVTKLPKNQRSLIEAMARPQDPQSYVDSWLITLVRQSVGLIDAGRSPGETAASLVATVTHAYGLASDPAAVKLVDALVSHAVERVLSAQAKALAAAEEAEAQYQAELERAKVAKIRAAVSRSLQGGIA